MIMGQFPIAVYINRFEITILDFVSEYSFHNPAKADKLVDSNCELAR